MTGLKELESLDEYRNLIEQHEHYTVLAFLSENSARSVQAEHILRQLSEESSTPIWGVNVKQTPDIHPVLSVTQVPTVVTIRNGRIVKKLVGLQNRGTYQKLISDSARTRMGGTRAPTLKITVYSTRSCPHCTTVKNHLKRKGVPFREVDVGNSVNAASELRRRTGQTGVPQTEINGTFVLGADISKINRLIDNQ
jgi:glutaredoxin